MNSHNDNILLAITLMAVGVWFMNLALVLHLLT